MPKKKIPQTIEECNAELERTEKQLQQYENRNKMLNRKLSAEKRKERNHRIFLFGGFMESIVPHCKEFRSAGVFEKTSRGGGSQIIPLVTRAHLYTLAGVVRSAESL